MDTSLRPDTIVIENRYNQVSRFSNWFHSKINESILTTPLDKERTEALYRVKTNLFTIEALFSRTSTANKQLLIQNLERSTADFDERKWREEFMNSFMDDAGFNKHVLEMTKTQIEREISIHLSKHESQMANRKKKWLRFYK